MKLVAIFLFIPIFLIAQTERVKISGEYSYTYGDSESLKEAKEICYTMALRNAIETHQTFITSTATVKDYQMIKDLVNTLSLGHIEDIKVVNEEIKGRKIYYKIEGYVRPVEVKNVLSREIKKAEKQEEFDPIMENEYIKILSVKDSRNDNGFIEKIIVNYRQKKRGGPHFFDYMGNIEKKNESNSYSIIVFDYFDINGDPIYSRKEETSKGLHAKMFSRLYLRDIDIPDNVNSYRIWFLENTHSE